MAPFDPYHHWLGIPPHEQPVNFYRLLGLVLFESNFDLIAQAADRQSMHVGSFQNSANGGYCEQLMGEIGQAAACLLDPQQKASYDHHLQDMLAARGERSVMSAPPPPSAAGFNGDFNAYGSAGSYGQQPMQNDSWSNGMQQPSAFALPPGEMPMPQFNMPPTQTAMPGPMPGMPNGMGHGMGGGGMNPPQQPMQNFLQSPPAPMQAMPPQHRPMAPQHRPMAPQRSPMQPQARVPQPAPFPKAQLPSAQRPIPVAARAGTAMASAATTTPPQPPPSAPPRPVDELEDLTSTPTRRRFIRKKRNQVPTELIIGGVVLALGALAFVIYAATNGGGEKHGFDRIDAPNLPVTTAADAAADDVKKAQAAKDGSKKSDSQAATKADKKSRAITTMADSPKPKRPKSNAARPNGSSDASDDIVAPNHFGPPPHGADDASLNKGGAGKVGPNNDAPSEVHAEKPNGSSDDDVMEDIIGGNANPQK